MPFQLSTGARVRISFRYQLTQAGAEELEEVSEALMSIDGRLVGQAPYDVLAQLNGDGNGGATISTGWKWFDTDLGFLSAGSHSLLLGGFTNRKTSIDEQTAIRFDDLWIRIDEAGGGDVTIGPREIVGRLSFDDFKQNIFTLAQFGDRLEGTNSYFRSADWVAGRIANLGYAVERAPYIFAGQLRDSIYCEKVGTLYPDRMFIVSAHLDGRGGGGAADDDASGCSLLLEIARVLADPSVSTEVTIRLVFWNNEESGLQGSSAYANNRRIEQGQENPPGSGRYPEPTWLGIIQHDMILFDHGLPPQPRQIAGADCDIEFQSASVYSSLSQQLANALARGNINYAQFYRAQVTNDMSNTDSVPFQDFAPACSFRENRRRAEIGNGANPHWHQPSDVYNTYSEDDFLFGFNIVQTTLGTVAELTRLRT